jgi:glutamate-ammonia-ligase adenylyltransferase
MEHTPDPRWQAALEHSHYLRNLLNNHPALIPELLASWTQPLSEDILLAPLKQAFADDDAVRIALRRLRQRAMAHIALRDLCGLAPLGEIVESMTMLADVTTNFALDFYHRQLVTTYGEPLDKAGQPQRLLIIGMGKLGGRELNVSSDVDYIFVYPEEGDTAGPRSVENFDFFTRLGKRIIGALGDLTADGQVFRVDMRLRPNGDSGPLVCSLDALENYFITQGREWERYAWIKSRVMNAGPNADGAALGAWMLALRRISRPFVFRKYLDFGAINAMRDLHAQIRREVARKDKVGHVKLGPGGIREVEFIAQVFQLIRGGRDPSLQIRPTLSVLKLLAERKLIPSETERELREAYVFLRRVEHRLQYVEDKQTHTLPEDDDARTSLARSMNFTDWQALMSVLDEHRRKVSSHFEEIFSDPESGEHALTGVWLGQHDEDATMETLGNLGFRHPREAIKRLAELRASSRYQQLPSTNRSRIDAVGPRLIEAAGATSDPDITLVRGLNFLESISPPRLLPGFAAAVPDGAAPRCRHDLRLLPGQPNTCTATRCCSTNCSTRASTKLPPTGSISAKTCGAIWPTMPAIPSAKWTSCAKSIMPRLSGCWPRIWPACRPSKRSPITSPNWPIPSSRKPCRCAGARSRTAIARRRNSPSSATARWAARNSAMPPISIWFISMTTMPRKPAKTTAASASA